MSRGVILTNMATPFHQDSKNEVLVMRTARFLQETLQLVCATTGKFYDQCVKSLFLFDYVPLRPAVFICCMGKMTIKEGIR